MELNKLLNAIASNLKLGTIFSPPIKVTGGLMHSIYKIITEKDTYIIKLLNPHIMKRAGALDNFLTADHLETLMDSHNIPIIPSLIFNNNKLQELHGQYYYVFNWYAGKSLNDHEINESHIRKISAVLASIHQIDPKSEEYMHDQIDINFDYYIDIFKKQNKTLYDLLVTNKEILLKIQTNGNQASKKVPPLVCLCHNDMDNKNILWLNDEFKIIDLECLGYTNPFLELLELALSYSGYEKGNINFKLFDLFIKTYFKNTHKHVIDWEIIYDSNYNRLEWLEYNLKRALMIECDNIEEQNLGINQVIETTNLLVYYVEIKEQILQILA